MRLTRFNRLSCTLLCCAAALQASAFTVNALPGCLHEALATMPEGETLLEIKGRIDVRDFETLRDLRGVESLDLSGVSIAEHASPTPLFPGRTWFEANCLPPYSLFESGFTDIKLPATLVRIDEGALANSAVSRLVVPDRVRGIADYAFYNASALTQVTLPRALEAIGKWSFSGCTLLNDINLEASSVTELPDHCFSGTSSLQKLDTSRIINVGREVFSGSGLTHAAFPKVRMFAPFALYGMEALEGISIPSGAMFAEGLLMNAGKLTEVKGLPDIVPDLFAANCSSYAPAGAADRATRIGAFSFAGTCTSTLTLGSDLTSVAPGAFAACHGLEEIDARALAGYTPSVHDSSFEGIEVPAVKLIVQDDCEDIWKRHPVWGLFNVVRASMTDLDGIAEDVRQTPAITITVEDAMLTATASGPGVILAVYDMDGRRVALLSSDTESAAIALPELPRGVLLVNATSRAGESRRIKMLN